MKKICIVTPGYKPVPDVCGGAIEHLITELVKENEKSNDYVIDLYTVYDSQLIDINYKNTNIKVIRDYQKVFPIRVFFSLINRFFSLCGIRRHIDYITLAMVSSINGKYDVIVVENNMEMFFKLKKKQKHIPMIYHIHNDFDTVSFDYDKTKGRIIDVVKKADAVWTASYYLRRHIQDVCIGENVYVLENCIDKDCYNYNTISKNDVLEFKKKYGLEDDTFVILFSGRFDQTKGLMQFLDALLELNSDINVKALIVGTQWFDSKSENTYIRLLEDQFNKLEKKVVRCGYIDQSLMPVVYASVDLVVIPTQCVEAFGMVALEAITMGIPCVASKIGGLCDILDDSCAELIAVDERYSEHMASAILDIYNDKTKYEKMKQNALSKSRCFSDTKDYFLQFKELIDSITLK